MSKLTHKQASIIYANFSYLATKSHVVGTQGNRLEETISTSTQKTCQNYCTRTQLLL